MQGNHDHARSTVSAPNERKTFEHPDPRASQRKGPTTNLPAWTPFMGVSSTPGREYR